MADAADPARPLILFVDAYDSFSANIVALLRHLLHAHVITIKIDQEPSQKDGIQDSALSNFDAIVIGPGPGSPDNTSDTGHLNKLWAQAAATNIPVLGICLGFQNLCSRYGLSVTRLDLPCHGHVRRVQHHDEDIFEGVGEVLATHYNSLGVRAPWFQSSPKGVASPFTLSGVSTPTSPHSSQGSDINFDIEIHADGNESEAPLKILAWNDDGYVEAVKHSRFPFWGLQFHPESCIANRPCHAIIVNWWRAAQRHHLGHRNTHERLPHPPSVNPPVLASTADPQLLSCLNDLTKHCALETRHVHLESRMTRAQLADLCHSKSTQGMIAMLESSKRGRFSIYSFTDDQTWLLQQTDGQCRITQRHAIKNVQQLEIKATMETIEEFMSERLVIGGDPDVPFWGGLVGSISYEAGLDLSMPRKQSPRSIDRSRIAPDLNLIWVDRSIVLNNETGRIYILTLRQNDESWLSYMSSKVQDLNFDSKAVPGPSPSAPSPPRPISLMLPSHRGYLANISACLTHLHHGNSYELCLTTSANHCSPASPYALYASLQNTNPAPYSAYLSLGGTHILSSSPEQFLSWSRDKPHLDMMPMKGTISKAVCSTHKQAKKMLSTPKEEAENLMIVDLIRHDLHHSLGPQGDVSVEKLFEVVETENTYQLISHIRGHIPVPHPHAPLSSCSPGQGRRRQIMRSGLHALRTSLPPGSMTGAPKIRSCALLSDIEQRNRGIYSGVIGYFDVGGGGCWSVAIRCAYSHESEDEAAGKESEARSTGNAPGGEARTRKWHIGAGGAITVLSDPEQEWEEMHVKMDGVLRGFGVQGHDRCT